MAEDVRAHALARDPGALPQALHEQIQPIVRERQTRFGEEEVIFPGAAPFG